MIYREYSGINESVVQECQINLEKLIPLSFVQKIAFIQQKIEQHAIREKLAFNLLRENWLLDYWTFKDQKDTSIDRDKVSEALKEFIKSERMRTLLEQLENKYGSEDVQLFLAGLEKHIVDMLDQDIKETRKNFLAKIITKKKQKPN